MLNALNPFGKAYQSAVWHIALFFFPGPLRWGNGWWFRLNPFHWDYDEPGKTETTGFPTRPIAGCRTIGTTTSAGMDGQEAGRPNDWQNEMILCLVELWLTTHEVPWTKIQFQIIRCSKQFSFNFFRPARLRLSEAIAALVSPKPFTFFSSLPITDRRPIPSDRKQRKAL